MIPRAVGAVGVGEDPRGSARFGGAPLSMGFSIRWSLILRRTCSAFVGASTYGVREPEGFTTRPPSRSITTSSAPSSKA